MSGAPRSRAPLSQRGQKESGRNLTEEGAQKVDRGGGKLLLSARSKVDMWSYILLDNQAGACDGVDSTPSSNGGWEGSPVVVVALSSAQLLFQYLKVKPDK